MNHSVKFIDEEALFAKQIKPCIHACVSYLFKSLRALSRLSNAEISIRSDVSTHSIWNSEHEKKCTIHTYAKLLFCYLHELNCEFRLIKLARKIVCALQTNKHIVLLLVDDNELKEHPKEEHLFINGKKK